MNQWHTEGLSHLEKEFQTDLRFGLSDEEARSRLRVYGPNELPEGKRDSLFSIFLRQFKSPLIYLLIAASAVVFVTGEVTDSLIILFVILFNAVVGTIQEGKAQNTLAALKRFTESTAVVLREGRELIVADKGVVPGDIIILQEGEKVPADARLIESYNLALDEAALTGEAGPVHKETQIISEENVRAVEHITMVWKGTHVLAGSGRAVVTSTGRKSVIGGIGEKISLIDTEIPLKKEVRSLSRLISITVGAISVSLFLLGIISGKTVKEMFSTAVSLAVSIIPEGLPIVLTLVLATGVSRMAKRKALVKRLQAVEALGQAKVIAVDKTGTITKNEMMVKEVFVDGKLFTVGGAGYEPQGEITLSGKSVYPLNHPELILAAKIAAMNANAKLIFDKDTAMWRVAGDPTEAALLLIARKIGVNKKDLEEESPLLSEEAFDYRKKYHLTSHRIQEKLFSRGREVPRQFIAVTGAPEVILSASRKIFFIPPEIEGTGGDVRPLRKGEKAKIEKMFHEMSSRGLRVIAFGFMEIPLRQKITALAIDEVIVAGLFGLSDSLRPEVKDAMKKAEDAGVRVVMITGDHKITAIAIAKEAGIWHEGDKVITGEDLARVGGEELSRATVFARVTPEDKLKIVEAYRRRGEIVAMTGDGVNDAPSLVAADLGVAMGKIGTEVAKEAADIVLLDDNFGSIVSAIEEGRAIYKTIKKVILYLFSTSVGELFTIIGALSLGYPLPLLPAQILWLNLVTDGFLDIALAMEPREEGLLKEKPKLFKRSLVDSPMLRRIPGMALPMMIGTLLFFISVYNGDLMKGWTIALTTLAIFQWFNAWNCRHESKSVFTMNPFSNKFLVGATAIVIFLQIAAVHAPFMNGVLRTTPLTISEWLIATLVASSIIFVEEIRKFFSRKSLLARA